MYPKNTAGAVFTFGFRKTSDGSYATAGSPTAVRSIDGGAQAAGTGTFTHLGSGQWKYVAGAADMDGDYIGLAFLLADHEPVFIDLFTDQVFATTFDAASQLIDGDFTDQDGDTSPSLKRCWSMAWVAGAGEYAVNGGATAVDAIGPDGGTSMRTIPLDTTGDAAERSRIAAAVDTVVQSGTKGTVAAAPAATTTSFRVEALPVSLATFADQFVEFVGGTTLSGVARPIATYTVNSPTTGTITVAEALPAAPSTGQVVRVIGRQPE